MLPVKVKVLFLGDSDSKDSADHEEYSEPDQLSLGDSRITLSRLIT